MGNVFWRQRRQLEDHACATAVSEVSADGYRFPLDDSEAWLAHLRERGFAVVAGALAAEEVEGAKDLLWGDLQEATPSLSRCDTATWKGWKPGLAKTGLDASVSQGRGAWHVRGCPGVKRAFAHIWDTSDLIVSMDVIIVWRPWWLDESWRPETEGLHLDQNPFSKPGLECVQGMVPLLPATNATGGLQVVPFSHTDEAKEKLKAQFPGLRHKGDWCRLPGDGMSPVLLLARPGDLVLWDSRTVHGGLVGKGLEEPEQSEELARLSVAVAMTPRAWASEEVLQARIRGFEKGQNFNHSPHEAGTSTGTVGHKRRKNYQPIQLTDAQRALL
mmetsp:Transcript_107718/g.304729  ORF Transcript_107718/g.304729 Transcript_107718/m.304729 type:complete len:330 (-) Transcript_107718:95-1084(-)